MIKTKKKAIKKPRNKVAIKKKKVKVPRKGAAPKVRNSNTWADWEYFAKIKNSLRTGFKFWKPMYDALYKASRPSQLIDKKVKKEYKCAHCHSWFIRKEVEIDHIEECGTLASYEDIVPFLKRLTKEDINAYQILCKPCHKIKSVASNNERKLQKKLKIEQDEENKKN